MQETVERVSLSLREPLRAAWGSVEHRELVRVTLRDEDGALGVGEAGGLAPYDDLAPERALAAARDVAEWDLRARRAGRPVSALLAQRPLAAVPVNALVTAIDPAGASAQAAAAVADGLRCVKLKVGVGDDAGRVAAVRAAIGPDTLVRVDANGAWGVDEAAAALRSLAAARIELCEEPVHGVAAMRALRGLVDVPVAMDETAQDAGAAGSGAADLVCLKLGRLGGLTGLMEAAAAAREAGSEVYVASALEGPPGVAAALHAAAALRVTRPCGLATLRLLEGVEDPFPVRDGVIAVPPGPGLGV